uniref:Zinc finger MYM-type protein 1-like n=1 Tax=Nicotiana tabacum TaxID=4097 RepID=A0A1S3Y9K1_TOBAC|nr:PREDICTED: uncharacterized protein LOC107773774 [Nicotiana tabacum]
MGELEIGRGLNQELGLVRGGDTRWGSHYKSFRNFIFLFDSIVDVRDIDQRFSNLGGLGELSKKLVETKKNITYPLVFCLVKLVLLLPVATATVERALSAIKFIKNDLRNRMDDEFLDGCIVPYVEKKSISYYF